VTDQISHPHKTRDFLNDKDDGDDDDDDNNNKGKVVPVL